MTHSKLWHAIAPMTYTWNRYEIHYTVMGYDAWFYGRDPKNLGRGLTLKAAQGICERDAKENA
jgi:hypothetical protein